MRTVDVSFVGTLQPQMQQEIYLLMEVGKSPLGWDGEFAPQHLIQTDTIDYFPAAIAMYSAGKPSEADLKAHFKNTKIVILFDATSRDIPDLVNTAANCGCFILMDEALAARSRKLSPNCHAVFKAREDLLRYLYESLRNPVQEMLISVDLANRGLNEASLARLSEAAPKLASLKGASEFTSQVESRGGKR